MQRALSQKTLNRFASLKDHYGDRYFTAQAAKEYLGITKQYEVYDLLKALVERHLLAKMVPPSTPAQYRVFIRFESSQTTLDDAVAVSKNLQEQAVECVHDHKYSKVAIDAAKQKTVASTQINNKNALPENIHVPLPTIITVNNIKYVRMDRIAEVLLDQL